MRLDWINSSNRADRPTWRVIYNISQLGVDEDKPKKAQTMHYGDKVLNFRSVTHYKVEGTLYACTPRDFDSLRQSMVVSPSDDDEFIFGQGSTVKENTGLPYSEHIKIGRDHGWTVIHHRRVANRGEHPRYNHEFETKWKVISEDGLYLLIKYGTWDSRIHRIPNDRANWNPPPQILDIDQYLTLAANLRHADGTQRFADLALPAFETLHASNTNNLEFLADPNLIKQILELGTAIKSPGKTLKEVASIYLSYTFGAASTARDYASTARELFDYAQRCKVLTEHMHRKLRSRSHFSDTMYSCSMTSEYNLTAYVDNLPSGIMKTMASAQEWGLYPSPSAMWDFIPFSFVLDWFVNVNENTKRMEYNQWRQYYNCRASILSSKYTLRYSPHARNPNILTLGSVAITAYSRNVSPQLPEALCNLELKLPGARSWMAGSALAVQKLL